MINTITHCPPSCHIEFEVISATRLERSGLCSAWVPLQGSGSHRTERVAVFAKAAKSSPSNEYRWPAQLGKDAVMRKLTSPVPCCDGLMINLAPFGSKLLGKVDSRMARATVTPARRVIVLALVMEGEGDKLLEVARITQLLGSMLCASWM